MNFTEIFRKGLGLIIQPSGSAKVFAGIFLMVVSIQSYGQQKAKVSGIVQDSLSTQPLGYASISILSQSERKLVTGALSADDGSFSVSLAEGDYYAEVNFVGYKTITLRSFKVAKHTDLNLGIIALKATEDLLDEVV